MSISATRSAPQTVESLLKFKIRPTIEDSKSLSNLQNNDIVTAGPVKSLNSDLSGLADKIPTAPSEDGEYNLTCTVSGTTTTYSWESVS